MRYSQACSGARKKKPDAIKDSFLTYIAVVKPELVIVDTLAQCMAGGNENGPDMIVATETCGVMQRAGHGVLLIHHEPRNAKHERGHVSLRGAAYCMLRMERKNKGPIVTLSCEKTKDSAPFLSERYRLTSHLRSVVLCVDGAIIHVIAWHPVVVTFSATPLYDAVSRPSA
jgi:hypothetical protein